MRALKEGGVYLGASIAEKALPFLLLPFLTRLFSTEEYGLIMMFSTATLIYSLFIGSGLNGFIRVIYHKVKKNEFKNYIGSVISIATASLCFVILGTLVFQQSLSSISGLSLYLLMLAIIAAAISFLINLRLVVFQTSREPLAFAKLQLLKPALDGSLVALFVFYLSGGAEARIYASVIACFIIGAKACISLYDNGLLSIRLQEEHVRRIMKFVVPVLPHSVILSLVFTVDKLMLTSGVGLSIVGEIAVSLALASPMLVVTESINRAFMPWSFEKFKNQMLEDAVGASYVLMAFMFVISIVYSILLMFLFEYMVGEKFSAALDPALILIWAGFLKLAYFLVIKGLVYSEKMNRLVVVSTVSGGVYMAFLYQGLESLTLVSLSLYMLLFYFMMFVGAFWLSQTVFPQPWWSMGAAIRTMRLFTKAGIKGVRLLFNRK